MSSSLAKNSVLTLFANLSFSVTNWLLLVVIAKFYHAEFLGQFVLTLSIVSPIFLFFSLKLRTLVVVDVANEFQLEQYLGSRLLFGSLGLLCALVIGSRLFESISISILFLIGMYKWCDSWSELCYAYYHRYGRFDIATKSQCARSTLSILVILLSAWVSESAYFMVFAWTIVTVVFAAIDLTLLFKLHLKAEGRESRFTAVFTFQNVLFAPLQLFKKYYTLGLSLIVGALFVYIPNFVIEKYSGIEAAGQFATVSYFLIAGGLLIHSVSQATSPKLARLADKNEWRNLTSLTLTMCAVGAAIGVLGVLVALFAGEFFLTLFYNPEIGRLSDELLWVLMAAAIRYIYIFIGTAMNAIKQFHIQTYIYGMGTVCVLLLCLILVPEQGTLGAAKAMVFATIVECLMFVTFFFRDLHKRQRIHD